MNILHKSWANYHGISFRTQLTFVFFFKVGQCCRSSVLGAMGAQICKSTIKLITMHPKTSTITWIILHKSWANYHGISLGQDPGLLSFFLSWKTLKVACLVPWVPKYATLVSNWSLCIQKWAQSREKFCIKVGPIITASPSAPSWLLSSLLKDEFWVCFDILLKPYMTFTSLLIFFFAVQFKKLFFAYLL